MFLNVDTGIKNKNWGVEEKNCINEEQGFYQHDKEIALDAWFGCVLGRLIGRPNMMKDSGNACIFLIFFWSASEVYIQMLLLCLF